jgi:hypothetical protein
VAVLSYRGQCFGRPADLVAACIDVNEFVVFEQSVDSAGAVHVGQVPQRRCPDVAGLG